MPTHNGASRITESLKSLASQSMLDFELIIVVDGSTDNTVDEVRKFESIFSDFLVLVGNNKGRAGARNSGASAAKGKTLIFVDDDVRLFPDAIALHQQFHQTSVNQILFGHLEMDPVKATGNDFWVYRRRIESSWRVDQVTSISFHNFAFTSANMSIGRANFMLLDGFDSGLRDSEDLDFGVRALNQGLEIKYNPQLRGYHDDFSSLTIYIMRQREYFKSKYELLRKHPEYVKLLPQQFIWINPRLFDPLKGWIFSSPWLWTTLFQYKPFLFIPRLVRHRLYNFFIYAQSIMPIRKQQTSK